MQTQIDYIYEKQHLEEIYKLYPRKEGKAAGLKKLKKLAEDKEQFALFLLALGNYSNHIKLNRVSREYTLMFSTFVNGRWQDYVNYEPPIKTQVRIVEQSELDQDPYYLTLKTVQLHRVFEGYLDLVKEVFTEHDEFIAYLSGKKRWFMKKYQLFELKGCSYQDFRAFLTIALKGEIGVCNRR
jgi:hypothetical protein